MLQRSLQTIVGFLVYQRSMTLFFAFLSFSKVESLYFYDSFVKESRNQFVLFF
jgi:hypothetical protein